MASKETYITWLQNAHAMEQEIVKVLENHKKQADGYPELVAKIDEHLELTKAHADKVKTLLTDLNTDVSEIKSMLGQMMGIVVGPSSALVNDTVIKNNIAEYTTEHMEIATYRTLIAAANSLGLVDSIVTLEEILKDEVEMAEWLHERLPNIVSDFLKRTE